MKHLNHLTGLLLAAGLTLALPAQAVDVEYTIESLSASDWRYFYTVTNDSLGVDIEEFTINFDRTLYTNLIVDASPADWDSLVAQPDNDIPADGYFDSLALSQGIANGESLGGFSVRFTYLGTGTPGAQPFEVVDSDFNVLVAGMTAPVPEAQTYLMLLTGLGLLGWVNRARKTFHH